MKNFIKFLLILFILLIFVLIFYVGTKNLSSNETILLSIVLTITSILATIVVSHYYSIGTIKDAVDQVNLENQSKLKTYAQKATEKVDSLSKELKKLSLYLQDELEQEYETSEEESISREEKIRSAIYITETLKSMNDNALSDWKGVIPTEFEEREELEREKNEEISTILERYEDIMSESQERLETRYTEDENDDTHKEIKDLKKQISLLVKNLNGIQIPKSNKKIKYLKEEIKNPCPSCESDINYKQRPLINSVKNFKCKSCGAEIIGRWHTEKGFYLELPIILDENINCPNCNYDNYIKLNSKIHSTIIDVCTNCKIPYKAVRRINDILIKPTGIEPSGNTYIKITDNLIDIIKKELPEQPWPTGIHKEISEKLNLPTALINKIINILIDRGEAFVQYKGKVYIEKK